MCVAPCDPLAIMPRKDVYMKKAMLKVVLPAVAALAVVGSGYAIWFFNGVANATASVDLKITDVADAGKFEMKQNSADYVDGADCLVFDQGARDDALGHGANGQGVKFVADTTDIKGDTYDGMQDIVVNYRKATTTTSTTAKTIYFKGYVAVPANMDKVINFKEATIVAADDADLTADKITKVTGYNYYRLNTVASGNDNADTAPVYTITNDMFVYDTAVVDTSTKAGYDTVKADFDLDKNLTVGFTFVANYVND
jgi:hypothetical protein